MKPGGIQRGNRALSQDDAEALAIAALGFLADDPERLSRFLALSGLTAESLRRAAAAPGFLGAVLDHLEGDDRLLVAFAAQQNCDPAQIARARTLL